MAEKKTLRIYYEADGVDEELDKKLRGFMKVLDYSFYASGYNLENKVRDLAFEKKK